MRLKPSPHHPPTISRDRASVNPLLFAFVGRSFSVSLDTIPN